MTGDKCGCACHTTMPTMCTHCGNRWRAERDALAAALADIAGMRLVHTDMDGTELWVADAECADMHDICWQRWPDRPHDWCQTCVAEVAWCAWKLGVL